MNTSINVTTGKSLMKLLYATHARLISQSADASSTISAITEFFEKINESIQLIKDHHVIAKTSQATQAIHRRRAERNYQVRDLMYFNIENLCLRIEQQGRSAKFFPWFVRPFLILKAKLKMSS